MNAFYGRLTNRGTLKAGAESTRPVRFLDCEVLVRGYIADRSALSRGLNLNLAPEVSDPELLAHAFRKWGQELQAHVIGEYAAVLWDVRAQAGLLTHDSFGLASLFYAQQLDGVAFATHLLDLVSAQAAETLDGEYLADFLGIGFPTNERTPFASICRLLPGQSLWWSDGQLRRVRSWDLAHVSAQRRRDNGEYEEEFRTLLRAGVRAALAPAGGTWVSLSGGLDSSSIACVAGDCGARGLTAYSVICPDWPAVDERPWMQAVVEQYELPWHRIDVDRILPFSMLPATLHGEPTVFVMDEKRVQVQEELLTSGGARVLLSGHGGDAVLCASRGPVPTHLADALFDGRPMAAVRGMNSWKCRSREHRSYAYWMLRTLVEPAVEHLRGRPLRGSDRRVPLPPWVDRDYAKRMSLRERGRQRIATACKHPGRQAVWDSLWTLSVAVSAGQRRHAPYEFRAPLMYRPLVEFMCGIPWEQKLRPQCDRYLQRRALKGVLPEVVRRRAGKASGNPMVVEGLRRSRDWFEYLCERSIMAELGIVDADRWRDAVRQASVGQTFDDKFFLAAVVVEGWLKQLREYRKGRYGSDR